MIFVRLSAEIMRRFFYWYVPLGAAIASAVIFGAGFYSFLRGDIGKPVDYVAPQRAQAAAPPPALVPIIIGDSLARGTGDSTGLGIGGRLNDELRRRKIEAKRTINIAVNGARTADLLRQLESTNVRRLLRESNVIVVSIGGNDLWGGADWRTSTPPNPDAVMDDVLERIVRVVKVVREANPNARVFLVGLYNPFRLPALNPWVSRWNAKLIERFSSDPNVAVVQTADIFSHRDRLSLDRFHPNDEGYELIARRIADAL
jgi:lysophospholipase L1-like esterase